MTRNNNSREPNDGDDSGSGWGLIIWGLALGAAFVAFQGTSTNGNPAANGKPPPISEPERTFQGQSTNGKPAANGKPPSSEPERRSPPYGKPSILGEPSGEESLKKYVKENIQRILNVKTTPLLIAEEWSAPADHRGKGDLVYRVNKHDYVIELKWIDYEGEELLNPTRQSVKTRNKNKKKHVEEQALKYGEYWASEYRRNREVTAMAIINLENGDCDVIFKKEVIYLDLP